MPANTTGRLPNLLHSGDTKNMANAMGTAPTMPSTLIAVAALKPSNIIVLVKVSIEAFFIEPAS